VIGFLQEAAAIAATLAQWGVTLAALVAAVLAWGGRFHPAARGPASELFVLAFGAAIAVAAWTGSAIRHDSRQQLEQAQRDLERWRQVAEEQAKQRAEFAAVAFRQTELAQERAQELEHIQEVVDDYEDALASGIAGACAADDAYSRAMQSIRIRRP
jgi:hypothetical protein